MVNILHISDFHLNVDIEKSKFRLNKLCEAIKENKINIDIIVFTGDVIDSRKIKNESIDQFKLLHKDKFSSSYEKFEDEILKFDDNILKEFTDLIIKNTNYAFNVASKVFQNFCNILRVDVNNIILCCGNHDRLRIIGEEKSCMIEDASSKDVYFQCFNNFCKSLPLKYTYETCLYESEGYTFLINNSNWDLTNKKDVCFNCNELFEKLKELKHDNKAKNIFVSHQPTSDFCEKIQINYSGDLNINTIESKIKEKCSTLLFGDKHGDAVCNFDILECICGAPLHENKCSYNILRGIDEINDGKLFLYKSIVWNQDLSRWIVMENPKEFKSYFYEAYSQFSNLTLDYLGKYFEFENLHEFNNNEASDLFKLICKIKDASNGETIIIDEDTNIFDYTIKTIINKSIFKNSFNLKGVPKMGKTFFLNILYLTVFKSFLSGDINKFPMYINIDKFVNEDIKTFKNYEEVVKEKFSDFLKQCKQVYTKYNVPIICIVDGLNQKNVYGNESFEYENENIEHYILEEIKKCDKISTYIMSFNNCDFPNYSHTIKNIDINCGMIFYFNLIDIIQIDLENKKIFKIIKLLSDMFKLCITIEDFYNNLLKLHTCSMNLRSLYRYLKQNNIDKSSFNLDLYVKCLQNDYEKIKTFSTDETYYSCAYSILMEGKTYKNMECDLSFYSFWKMKNNVNLIYYLVANYYIQLMQKCTDYDAKDDFTNNVTKTILSQFIPRNIAFIIRTILKFNKDYSVLNKFINYVVSNDITIPYITHSMLYYLVSHLGKKDLLNKLNQITSISIVGMNKEKDEFFKFCVERSKIIAYIVCESSQSNIQDNLFPKLLTNNKYRELNRIYQILYYGDNTFDGYNNRIFDVSKDIVQHGFDFHNTFLTLIAKLDYSHTYSEHKYYLKDFDLFTLCDFIYTRLSSVKVEANNKSTLFYYYGYNNKTSKTAYNVLNRFYCLLNEYVEQNKNSYNMKFAYFRKMLSVINISKTKIDNKFPQNTNEIVPYVHPVYEIEKIFRIEKLARIGWYINDTKDICEEERNNLGELKFDDNYKESISDYILELVYIAIFLLPKELPKDGNYTPQELTEYSKEKIIMLILLHELGKIETKDFFNKSQKIVSLKQDYKNAILGLMSLGATVSFADLSSYFNEMQLYLDKNDINCTIVKQLKIVQKEYKYRKLLSEGKINFNKERVEEFETDLNTELIDVCKKIKYVLIDTNPNIKNL